VKFLYENILPFDINPIFKPFSTTARAISKKNGLMVGSPPHRATVETPDSFICWSLFKTSALCRKHWLSYRVLSHLMHLLLHELHIWRAVIKINLADWSHSRLTIIIIIKGSKAHKEKNLKKMSFRDAVRSVFLNAIV